MDKVTWTVTEANGKTTTTGRKRPHRQPIEITEKTAKAQMPFIEGWNEMRQDCIDHGIMEPK